MAGRWEKEGEVYIKTIGDRASQSAGLEQALFAKMIPPFVQPRQYWLTVKIRGSGSVGPTSIMSYRMRGVNVPVPRDQKQIETDDVTGDEFLARYATEEVTEVLEPDDIGETDAGLIGDSPFLSDLNTGNFMDHRGVLGLPDKAVFVDASLIAFVDQFTRKGHIRKNKEIDEPGFLALGFGADDISASIDWGDIMWGDAGDFETLAEDIVGLMPKFQTEGASIGTSAPTGAALLWLQKGFTEDSSTIAQTLIVSTRMTVKCDVYTNKRNRIISVS